MFLFHIFMLLLSLFQMSDTSTNAPSSTGGEPGSSADDGTKGGQPTGQSGDDKPKDEPKFTQGDLDRTVQARLAEEAAREKKRTEAATKKAQEEALAKNAEWQKLAETRATELETLKPRAELADKLAIRMNTLIEAEIADWPEEVTALDPGDADLDARLTWLEKSRALAAKLKVPPAAPNTETGKGGTKPPSNVPPVSAGQAGQPASYRFQSAGDVKW